MPTDRPWFRPKDFGYGAGLPIRWQGWALTAAFVGLAVLDARFLHGLPRVATLVVLIAIFLVIAAAKTDGGWRWRWNGRDRP
jgi:hypothetical protein